MTKPSVLPTFQGRCYLWHWLGEDWRSNTSYYRPRPRSIALTMEENEKNVSRHKKTRRGKKHKKGSKHQTLDTKELDKNSPASEGRGKNLSFRRRYDLNDFVVAELEKSTPLPITNSNKNSSSLIRSSDTLLSSFKLNPHASVIPARHQRGIARDSENVQNSNRVCIRNPNIIVDIEEERLTSFDMTRLRVNGQRVVPLRHRTTRLKSAILKERNLKKANENEQTIYEDDEKSDVEGFNKSLLIKRGPEQNENRLLYSGRDSCNSLKSEELQGICCLNNENAKNGKTLSRNNETVISAFQGSSLSSVKSLRTIVEFCVLTMLELERCHNMNFELKL